MFHADGGSRGEHVVDSLPEVDTAQVRPTTDEHNFLNWLAGFIDGEGCFKFQPRGHSFAPSFVIRLRADDREILEEIAARTGLGKLYELRAFRTSRPQIAWQVESKDDCAALIAILDEHHLRARKARDYAIWRAAVLEFRKFDWDRSRIEDLVEQLKAGRAFEEAT